MREMEFKAKRGCDGVWVYGFLSDIDEITAPDEDDSVGYHTMDAYSVIPETVCQWAGLFDKQGVKIFEGDIFQYRKHDGYLLPDFTGEVLFRMGCFGYVATSENMGEAFRSFSEIDELEKDFLDHIEVIGNIHDKAHPKLALINMMRLGVELGLYDCVNE